MSDKWLSWGGERAFFRPAYRWDARPVHNLLDCARTIANFFQRVWRYRAWLANDAEFDWMYLAEIIETKLRAMADHFAKHGMVTDAPQMVAECREAADILARLGDYTKSHEETERDRARFGELMAHIEWWWD